MNILEKVQNYKDKKLSILDKIQEQRDNRKFENRIRYNENKIELNNG